MRKIILPKLHISLERWKYNREYDVYVSTLGRLKDKEGKICSVCKHEGYLRYRGKPVHRIVAETWIPTPGSAFLTVDHLNHNTFDNRVCNLEVVTKEENTMRDKADCAANKPEPVSKNEKPIGYVLLNGAEVKLSTARTIMYNDKSIGGARSQIDKLFSQIENGAAEGKYGNYVLKRVA